jgi:hypothetical protein
MRRPDLGCFRIASLVIPKSSWGRAVGGFVEIEAGKRDWVASYFSSTRGDGFLTLISSSLEFSIDACIGIVGESL